MRSRSGTLWHWPAITSVLFSFVLSGCGEAAHQFAHDQGAIVRGDSSSPEIALVFTGDRYADGAEHIAGILNSLRVKASFFLTGRFYRNRLFSAHIEQLRAAGHYLGAHSDRHLLYCSWENRDSVLVSRTEFRRDLVDNYVEMSRFGIQEEQAPYFLPAYEWHNDQISEWTRELGLQLINYTPGTRSHADYTTPDMEEYYVPSERILDSILSFEDSHPAGLNGFILLSHIGVAPERTDKFYLLLGPLITELRQRGYVFVRIDDLLD